MVGAVGQVPKKVSGFVSVRGYYTWHDVTVGIQLQEMALPAVIPPVSSTGQTERKVLGRTEHDLQREEGRTVVEEVARFIRVGKQWKRKPEVRMVKDNDQGR